MSEPVLRVPSGSDLARKGPRASGRRKVLMAAAIAFQERGYDGTSIDDIADVMSASKGRVYYYYRSKQAIYLDTRIAALELLCDALRAARDGADGPEERLRAMITGQVELARAETPLMRIVVGGHFVNLPVSNTPDMVAAVERIETVRLGIEAMYREVLEDGMRAGVFRSTDPGVAAMTCMASAMMVVLWRPGLPRASAPVAAEIARIVIDGLRA